MTRLLRTALLGIAIGVTACSQESSGGSTSAEFAVGGDGGRALALGDVMRRAHFAFRPDASVSGSFRGGDETYAVRVDADGRWAFTPRAAGDREAAAWRIEKTTIARATPGVGASRAIGIRASTQDGSLALERALATERLENRPDGVEQAWRFDARPRGTGDLVVRLTVAGESYVGASASGQHFVDPATGVGVRYGLANWVDADGARTPVAVGWDASTRELVLTVPAALADGSAYPAVLDPVVGPEFGMDGPITLPAQGEQTVPSVAFNGSTFLVVWEDRRFADSDVFGARVTPGGQVLDPTGIPIGIGLYDQKDPVVAYGGIDFLVAWRDNSLNYVEPDIFARRVNSSGAVLDPTPIKIVTLHAQEHPALAFDGTNYLLVWEDSEGGPWHIEAQLLSSHGAPIGSPFAVSPLGAVFRLRPQVSAGGGYFLVAWHDFRSGTNWDLYAARVSAAGAVVGPNGFLVSGLPAADEIDASVAFDGANFFVVWEDGRNGTADIFGKRVSPTGQVLNPNPILVSGAANRQILPAVTFDGTNYDVAWQDFRSGASWDVYGARVTPAGAVLNPSGIVVSAPSQNQMEAAIAYGANVLFLAWQDHRSGASGTNDIYAARMSKAGTLIDPAGILVSKSTNPERWPAVARGAGKSLVVWQDERTGGQLDIYGARLDDTGTVLDPNGIALSTAAGAQRAPSAAFDGTNFFVVWGDERSGVSDIYGARVSAANGAVLDANGVALSTALGAQTEPDIAFDGSTYLVAWRDDRNATSDVFATRVTTSGGVLDPAGKAIATAVGAQVTPAVAYGAGKYLVTWDDGRNGTHDVYAARVTPAGALLDPVGFLVDTADDPAGALPDLAFDGTNFYVVWDAGIGDIWGSRVSPAAVVLDNPPLVITWSFNQLIHPTIAYDAASSHYLVTWEDGAFTATIRGMRVGTNGQLLDAAPTAFVDTNDVDFASLTPGTGIVPIAADKWLVAYTRRDTTPGFGNYRIRARIVTY